MENKTLNILINAISTMGIWEWWTINDDNWLELSFSNVMLFEKTEDESDTHSGTFINIRLSGNIYAIFLDNSNDENDLWYVDLYNGKASFWIDPFELRFDDNEYALSIISDFKNKTVLSGTFSIEKIAAAKHSVAGKCENVGFIIGGDHLAIIGLDGKLSEGEIELASKQWWDYWWNYWNLKNTTKAYKMIFYVSFSLLRLIMPSKLKIKKSQFALRW
jgi:nitrogen regulatory protein PII-like uncharacterized protein